MYSPKHFILKEFVPPEVFSAEGANSIILLDERMLITADQIREFFNAPVIINNWHMQGSFKYRGYRPPSYTGGAAKSMHKLGMALDFNVADLSPQQVREAIIKNAVLFPHISRIELDTPTWTHVDCKDTGKTSITFFKPFS